MKAMKANGGSSVLPGIWLANLLLVAAANHSSLCRGQSYEFMGEVQHFILHDGGQRVDERKKPFIVIISGSNWWMRTEGIAPRIVSGDSPELKSLGLKVARGAKVKIGVDGGVSSTEFSSTGSDLYMKEVTPARPNPGTNAVTRKFASEAIEIYTNRNVPTFSNDLCFPVWLALCSGTYFQDGESYTPPIIWSGFVAPENSGAEFRVVSNVRKQATLSFLEDARFENRGYLRFFDESHNYSVKRAEIEPYIEAHYRVLSWADEGGTVYPRESQLEFYPPPQSRTGEIAARAAMRVLIFVTSCRPSLATVPAVRPTALARVTDHRIRTKNGPVTYITTNTFMPPESEVAAHLIAQHERRTSDLQHRLQPFSKPLFVTTLLILLFLPGGLIFLKFAKNRTKQ